jgi:peptidoglycan/xylan/chitin deacetylase (PgdA/CDA1 family)
VEVRKTTPNSRSGSRSRGLLRKLAFALLRWTGLPFLFREVMQRNQATIILFHDPRPDVADGHFRILKSRYNIIGLRDYVEARQSGSVGRLPSKALIITLDDGCRGNYGLLPVILRHSIPITVFLSTGLAGTDRHFWFEHDVGGHDHQELTQAVDEERLRVLRQYGFEETRDFSDRQALSKAEIEEMKEAVDFQSHTRFHPILPRCSAEKAWQEILESKRDLEREYGVRVYALAYPNGEYSERETLMAAEAGYQCAVTIDSGYNGHDTDLFLLRRLGLTDDADINELLVKTSGLWGCLRNVWRRLFYLRSSMLSGDR